MDRDERLKASYEAIAEMTHKRCGQPHCRVLSETRCCAPEYCEIAITWASERWDVQLNRTEHPTLPLMGPNGCTAAPHFRPLCSMHQCKINSIGTSGDLRFDRKYFKLRERIEDLEMRVERKRVTGSEE